MALTAAQLREIRAEVGSDPNDAELQTLWDALGNTTAVALDVLRIRRSDALTAAGQGGFTLSGILGVSAPTADVIRQLDTQIARLEAALADQTGEPALLAASSVVVGRYDRPR